MRGFELYDATTVKEVVDLLGKYSGRTVEVVGGGSDIVGGVMKDWVQGKGMPLPEVLIDITTIKDIVGIKSDGGGTTIGAATTLSAVIPGDDLTLASRQPPQRVLYSCLEVLLLVPLGEAVVDGRTLMRALFHQHVERDRERGALGPTVGTTSLVNTPELIDDRAANPQRRVGLEWHTAARIETIDGRNEADHRRGRNIIAIRKGGRRDPHAAGDADGKVRVTLDERPARLCAARATIRPQLGYVHASPPPPPPRFTPRPSTEPAPIARQPRDCDVDLCLRLIPVQAHFEYPFGFAVFNGFG